MREILIILLYHSLWTDLGARRKPDPLTFYAKVAKVRTIEIKKSIVFISTLIDTKKTYRWIL